MTGWQSVIDGEKDFQGIEIQDIEIDLLQYDEKNRRKFGKFMNRWKLNNTLPKNHLVKKEIKERSENILR